jgi:hypothetical protein
MTNKSSEAKRRVQRLLRISRGQKGRQITRHARKLSRKAKHLPKH